MGRVLGGLADGAWLRTCVHSEVGLMTLEQMLQAEVDHIPHHIRHIIAKREVVLAYPKKLDSL